MKVIVTGSRGLSNDGRLCRVLEPERWRIAYVLSGGARGADQLASCGPGGMACLSSSFRRRGTCLASRRGILRNRQIAQAGDILVAFHDGESRGTAHMIQCVEQRGKPVVVVRLAP